ncbi:uncharacterized protein AB675_291 [Cyphellophora attinorum]|uniref:CFEM domain-containing protein n=1 Tax=Cyphellophora attinorum TaxID=1664694 RepID=A0A0N1I1F7_9EURO|nr:uncharacterized protein AB675_291 [Phialophora attinorum]KPI45687.1 hypothetical protein AB675_291 [Phialophora attinorum]
MKFTISLLAFASVALVGAQSPLDQLATLPQCVQTCILNGITAQTDCPVTDPAVAECLCKNQAYYDSTNKCVATCTPEEQQAAAQYAIQACPNGGIAVDAANNATSLAGGAASTVSSAASSASAAASSAASSVASSASAAESSASSAVESVASSASSAASSASASVASATSGGYAAPTAMVAGGMKVLGALGLAVAAL